MVSSVRIAEKLSTEIVSICHDSLPRSKPPWCDDPPVPTMSVGGRPSPWRCALAVNPEPDKRGTKSASAIARALIGKRIPSASLVRRITELHAWCGRLAPIRPSQVLLAELRRYLAEIADALEIGEAAKQRISLRGKNTIGRLRDEAHRFPFRVLRRRPHVVETQPFAICK